MEIKCFTVNFMKENTYVVYDDTKECIIIDCGCNSDEEKSELASFIRTNNLTPKRLICTHFHLDHTFGNKFILEEFGLQAEACEADHLLSDMMHYQVIAFGLNDEDVDIPTPIYTISADTKIAFGNSELSVVATPGHSPGGVSFYSGKEGVLFSGDTLMFHETGATNLPGSRRPKLIKSIANNIFSLPKETRVFPGHGPATTIAEEMTNNPIVAEINK